VIDEAVRGLYRAFAGEPKPRTIIVCEYCVSEREVFDLLHTKLRDIKPAPLQSYAESVTLISGAVEDFKYLLPRILDVSVNDRRWWPSHEVTCASLARARWLEWPAPLVGSVMDLFRAALEKAIAEVDGRWIDELICGFALAGLDVSPFLGRLEAEDARKALVKFYECNSHSLMKGKLGNAFWRGQKDKTKAVVEWFKSPAISSMINGYYGLA
jgi:hypothetical protein